MFYEVAGVSRADKKLFTDAIEKVTWLYNLRTDTINVLPYKDEEKDYSEIEVIEVTLKDEKRLDRIAEVIMMAIPYAMRDKEKLLSFDSKLRFIFSHSALREGWDNPNVFQICTLNESKSEVKKRQEIGRGLRLCVDQDGMKVDQIEVPAEAVIYPHGFSFVLFKEPGHPLYLCFYRFLL